MESTLSSESTETSDSCRGRKLRKLTDILECCICKQDLRDAHICGLCSQPFCRKCIFEWLAKEQNCPHCRRALTKKNIVKDRVFDQLEAVVNELLDEEKQNRCQSHNREQLFFCFSCEESICERCAFEKVHLEHRDEVVLLEVAFDHFYKNISEDIDWIKKHEQALKKNQDCLDEDKKLLVTEYRRLDGIVNRVSKSLSSQYDKKWGSLERSQEKNVTHSDTISEMLTKLVELEKEEKTANSLEKLIGFKHEIEQLRSEASTTERIDINLEIDLIPSPVQITFLLNNYKAVMKEKKYCESTEKGTYGFVWKLKVALVKGCTMASLSLEQGTPGSYWVRCRGNQATLYNFELRKYVIIGVKNINDVFKYDPDNDTVEAVIRIYQARSYAEQCKQQQKYIERLEKKIAGYEETLIDIRKKAGFRPSEDENRCETESSSESES